MASMHGSYRHLSTDLADAVVLLQWPEQQDQVERLSRLHVPCLFLVRPDGTPPLCKSCLQDWIRLPVEDGDVRARMFALNERAQAHRARPSVDEYGVLSYDNRTAFLSPREQRTIERLIADFGKVVRETDLEAHVYGVDGNGQGIRVYVSRLRRHLAPIGLAITSIRSVGYVLHHADRATGPDDR